MRENEYVNVFKMAICVPNSEASHVMSGLEMVFYATNGLFTWFFTKFLQNFCEIFAKYLRNICEIFAKFLRNFYKIFAKFAKIL